MGFEPLPLGHVPIVLQITPREQARLASVEANTPDPHPPAVCVCVCVCVCTRVSSFRALCFSSVYPVDF